MPDRVSLKRWETPLRVSGHTLRHEGAAHVVDESGRVVRVWNTWGGVGGYGRGLCSCGAFSEVLASAHQRKKWHRTHKLEVTTAATESEAR